MRAQPWDAELYDTRHSFVTGYGAELLTLLDAHPGERVLDAGCGTGEHVAELCAQGVDAVGVDASPDMVRRARERFPDLGVSVADLRDPAQTPEPTGYDGVFSNAVLHWIPEAGRAAATLFAALRPGGRLVAELGGSGNIAAIDTEARRLRAGLSLADPASPWYFPTVAGYTAVLERAGFDVTGAWLFDRPTRLDGADGLRSWVRMFAGHLLAGVPDTDAFLVELDGRLRSSLYRDGAWWADYRRLRVTATRPEAG
ncbi:trans-aconitate methyltransferase [Lipingzhangella halophila]|uniref:Trans-aconitate methyltransferase n=1 Tax=Lipingzhangella halophila TaxID=1783352 RepID=A0A7W7W4V6_9ACTN|nr:class I SAM-dependent methyltransferase [Lipingzhangella halophila]MBB4934572.1 trans-aconitate methyltransferase [Lipingzhangella halophila]